MPRGSDHPLHLAFVVPRYGREIIGGAENATRMLAEALVNYGDATVEILTTTASSLETWDNDFPVGEEELNGVAVRRFKVDSGRAPNFAAATRKMLASAASLEMNEAHEFIRLQGPVSSDLLDAVESFDGDAVIFYPYLYHPITEGILRAKVPTIMHPAAHMEPVLRLPIFEEIFARVDALVYHTDAERAVVESRFKVGQKPALTLGMGFQTFEGQIGDIRVRLGIENTPFLLCLGRVDAPKGTTLLVDMFKEYKARNPSPLALVLAGPISIHPNSAPDVYVVGPVTEADKADLLSNTLCLVSPSAFESFSIVLIEAWAKKKPAMVNRLCEPTVEQVERSGGGLIFDGFESFELNVNRIIGDGELVKMMGNAGFHYVMSRYQWPVLVEKYQRFIARLLNRNNPG